SVLWKTTNNGMSYAALYNFGNGNTVWRYDIARSNYDVMYLCATNGVYKTTNGGTSWTNLSLPVTYYYYNSDIVVDPLDANRVYLCMANGDSTNKVLMSANGGTSWTNITGAALKNKKVAFLQYHGGSNGGVYAITNVRPTEVYYRDNTMSDWTNYSQGLPVCHEAREGGLIFYRDNKLRLAGNCSIWESSLSANAAPVAQPMCDRATIGCSSDTVKFYDYSMCVATGISRLWSFPGASWVSSTTAAEPRVLYPGPGTYNVSLKVTNASGLSHTRTVTNMVSFTAENCAPDTVAGKALQINFTPTAINLGQVNINSNHFSISCWVRPHGLQNSFAEIISHAAYPGSGGYGFAMGFTFAGYTPNLELCYTDSIVNYGNYSGLLCDSTQWNYVVLTYAPTGVTMYLNGRAAVVNSAAMPSIDLSQSPFYVNYDCHFQGGKLDADVDEVKFYDYALSQDEVREKMHLIQRNASSERGLLKYFQFNQYEVSSGLLHDVMSNYSSYVPAANIIPSTAPVATGSVYRNPAVNSAGLNNFIPADVALYLPAAGTYPNGEVVAFHLLSNPDTKPDSRRIVPGYFVINNYGADTSFTQPDSLVFSGLRIANVRYRTGAFKLFRRAGGAFGPSWGAEVDSADAFRYSATGSKLTYSTANHITSLFCQLVMVNSDTTGLAGVPLMPLAEGWN
ncbi:MAG: PKD domain-containing protein, partial [Chitinophagia bacterium]|nr:PKD domain-containing protein [Chitinophagia bacterium]